MSRIQSTNSRHRLQACANALAERRQREFEEATKWNNRIEYYKNWDSHNSIYQNWTSPEYYTTSNNQYDKQKREETKKKTLEQRRQKLRKLLFDEEQELETEITLSPRDRKPVPSSKLNQMPTEVLKDLHVGLKLAEDDKRRHEAELKLYHQWKNDSPIIRDFESNKTKDALKLAWLDQQIEKRMEQEKNEEELKSLLEKRDKAIKEEEEIEKLEDAEYARKEKQLLEDIYSKMQEFKMKEKEVENLKMQEYETTKKKTILEDILARRQEEIQKRKDLDKEIAAYNVNQSKIKLRKKGSEIEEQLNYDKKLIEELKQSQIMEEIQNEEKKNELKKIMDEYTATIAKQQDLELQRQKYISFVFDSEAKKLWDKQDRLWKMEQETRDKLLEDVLDGMQKQLDKKVQDTLEEQQTLHNERNAMLRDIEDEDNLMKMAQLDMQEKKERRRKELEEQINNKKINKMQQKLEEEARRKQELENIKLEEERIKKELAEIQKRQQPIQTRFNRRIVW